jgi:4-hydroxybenzoate polyprenyltransferase
MDRDRAALDAPASPLPLAALLRAMRPRQWPKNALVFAAFIFSAGEAWRPGEVDSWWPLLWRAALYFVAWCLVASGEYLFNDIRDREADRLHPRKRLRPVASGVLAPGTARLAAAILLAAGLGLAFAVDVGAAIVLAGYAAMMVAYSTGLKRVAVLDVLILTLGFVARAAGGGLAIDVEISPWLYVCTGAAAFFFASSKRWAEYRQLGDAAAHHRPSLQHYTREALDQMVVVSGAAAVLSYAVYTVEAPHVPANGAMALTLPFVVFAVFRYVLLVTGPREGDTPDEILLTDRQLLIAIAGWLAVAVAVLLEYRL